jgi:dTMP kinase
VNESERSAAQRGWFITVEGPDGSGKTLVATLVRDALAARGIAAQLTREPGGTAVGERIRAILLEHTPDDPARPPPAPLAPRADALLFAAARAQHVAEVIDPAVALGEVVLCARYADSTLAYQGYGLGLPLDELRELQRFATGGRWPDLTVLLDIPVEVGLARKQHDEQTRFEAAFDVAYHRRVRDGFLALAAAEPDRFVVVDATAPIDTVVAATLGAILGLLG